MDLHKIIPDGWFDLDDPPQSANETVSDALSEDSLLLLVYQVYEEQVSATTALFVKCVFFNNIFFWEVYILAEVRHLWLGVFCN